MSVAPAVPSKARGLVTAWAFWFAAAITALVFLAGIFAPYFSVDSWSYLELSNRVFTDFFRVNTLRRFETPSLYSQAFPPLLPVLIALLRKVVDMGIYTGTLLNFPICIGLLAGLIRLFQKIDFPGWLGAACYLALLGYRPFLYEATGGKSFPIYLTLLVCTLLIVLQEQVSLSRVAAAGLLLGLACLDRFDALAAACVIGAALGRLAHQVRHRLKYTLAVLAVFFATLVAAISPMIVYGMRHFGKPFPSDNTSMVTLARGGTSLDYYKVPPQSDLIHNPRKWLAGLLFFKLPNVLYGSYESTAGTIFPVLLGVVLVVWGLNRNLPIPSGAVRFAVLALILIPVMLVPTVLAGYRESRYYSGPLLLLTTELLIVLLALTPKAWNLQRASLLVLCLAAPLGSAIMDPLIANGGFHSLDRLMAPLSPTPEMQQVTNAVDRDSAGQPHRLIFTTGHITAVKYGALTGEPTAVMPRLVSGTFTDFARDWRITHVYDGPMPRAVWEGQAPATHAMEMRVIRAPGLELVPLDLPGLYRIRFTATPQHP